MGFKVGFLVDDLFSRYDHNRNSVIDYRKTAAAASPQVNENQRQDVEYRSKPDGTTYAKDKVVLSHAKLFAAADKNSDGKVTRKEMLKLVGSYDTDKNGKLDLRDFVDWMFNENKERAEYKHFIRAYPETKVR
ncbi:MAG: hypothetical protein ACAI44_03475 [Candidatus Sericytochromatia bacterium]